MFEMLKRSKVNLNNKQKKEIKEAYLCAISEAGDDEFEYVIKKFHAANSILKDSSKQWDRKLSEVCTTLYQILIKDKEGEINLCPDTTKHIIAALIYFVEPYDVICDYTPGIGYLDDAYVISLCINYLQKKESELFNVFFVPGKAVVLEEEGVNEGVCLQVDKQEFNKTKSYIRRLYDRLRR